MGKIHSSDELVQYIEQEQDTIANNVKANPELKAMIHESMEAYKDDRYMTTSDLLKNLSPTDSSYSFYQLDIMESS